MADMGWSMAKSSNASGFALMGKSWTCEDFFGFFGQTHTTPIMIKKITWHLPGDILLFPWYDILSEHSCFVEDHPANQLHAMKHPETSRRRKERIYIFTEYVCVYIYICVCVYLEIILSYTRKLHIYMCRNICIIYKYTYVQLHIDRLCPSPTSTPTSLNHWRFNTESSRCSESPGWTLIVWRRRRYPEIPCWPPPCGRDPLNQPDLSVFFWLIMREAATLGMAENSMHRFLTGKQTSEKSVDCEFSGWLQKGH